MVSVLIHTAIMLVHTTVVGNHFLEKSNNLGNESILQLHAGSVKNANRYHTLKMQYFAIAANDDGILSIISAIPLT